ncbi:MAG: rod-binding protein [Lachnospiraceae bacterium]|nr:rod-binding protein [Lachnospiraceae bacterium]
MDIGSLGSTYLNNVKDTAEAKAGALKNKLNNTDIKKASDDELMEVCKEFESYFIEQVFKNMKTAMVPSTEDTSGSMATLKNYYEDEMMKEYAKSASKQSTNGLAQMLFEQMKRNQGSDIPSK